MGPPLFNGGKSYRVFRTRPLLTTLQWGLRFSTEESTPVFFCLMQIMQLQWGLRFSTEESARFATWHGVRP